VPTLILAGTFDASTAPAWADQVTAGLSRAVVLHFPGVGHGVLPTSACAQSIMTEYLDRLDAAVDRTCIARMSLPVFRVP
jgi:pimeloyl-ACP methyl ester carboxylesterase